jgi:hypothetical protein
MAKLSLRFETEGARAMNCKFRDLKRTKLIARNSWLLLNFEFKPDDDQQFFILLKTYILLVFELEMAFSVVFF